MSNKFARNRVAALEPTTLTLQRGGSCSSHIVKGAKPADLPVEQPMTFELVANLKTAKLLELTMPPEIMVRATRGIQ